MDNLSGQLGGLPFTLESCLEETTSFGSCAESKVQLLKPVSAAAYVKRSYRLTASWQFGNATKTLNEGQLDGSAG